MTRSSNTRKTAALVLALGLIQGTLAKTGPGTFMDYWHNKSEYWSGAPLEGFHVKTETTGDGTYNQTIAKDADEGIAFINKDPADGVSGPYTVTKDLYCIPKGNYAEGYPAEELPDSLKQKVATALQQAAAKHQDGLLLQKSGSDHEKVTYNALADENDYMLLLFGAEWCRNSLDFMSQLAKYYKLHKSSQHSCTSEACKSFDVVYFPLDDNEAKYKKTYANMPWKSAGFAAPDSEQEALQDELEKLFDRDSLPALVVVNKAGKVLTTDGVNALRGKHSKGTFPDDLPEGGSLFDEPKDEPKPCPISEDKQIAELKQAVSDQVKKLDGLTLKYYARKVMDEGDMDAVLPEDDDKVRQYVCDKFQSYIEDASKDKVDGRERIAKLYARLQEEKTLMDETENQVFKIGDRVKILEDFTSDGEKLVKNGPSNMPNTGEIMDIKQDGKYTDAIQVKCRDNSMTWKWIKASNYKFIQKIESARPDRIRKTQSGHL